MFCHTFAIFPSITILHTVQHKQTFHFSYKRRPNRKYVLFCTVHVTLAWLDRLALLLCQGKSVFFLPTVPRDPLWLSICSGCLLPGYLTDGFDFEKCRGLRLIGIGFGIIITEISFVQCANCLSVWSQLTENIFTIILIQILLTETNCNIFTFQNGLLCLLEEFESGNDCVIAYWGTVNCWEYEYLTVQCILFYFIFAFMNEPRSGLGFVCTTYPNHVMSATWEFDHL